LRARHPRRLVVTEDHRRPADAIFLGLCSLGTQAILIRFILSSQPGGELYAAIAMGGWIGWVGFGSLLGHRLASGNRKVVWLFSSVIKLPLALFVYLYPGFFTGILDPVRFLPLALLGMAPAGIPYGLLFPALIAPQTKASKVYRNEALGSVAGGLLATLWILLRIGDFGLLIFLSMLELSRAVGWRRSSLLMGSVGMIVGICFSPVIDRAVSNARWPGFETVRVEHGFSGRWSLLARGDQLTIMHNGQQMGTLPDRQSSEDALLWPLLYYPDAAGMLLIGYEGLKVDEYLPSTMKPLCLFGDGAYTRLGVEDSAAFRIADPLSFSPGRRYDIVSIHHRGAGSLSDYRLETGFFYRRCLRLLKPAGILYVSVTSDENYVSPLLGSYLSSLRNTLSSYFDSLAYIPGGRAGFVCFRKSAAAGLKDNPIEGLRELNLDSPYFNTPYVMNRLAEFRISNFEGSLSDDAPSNTILRPQSVLRYLNWQGSVFGRSGLLFSLYRPPYIWTGFLFLVIIPGLVAACRRMRFGSLFAVAGFGFLGMSLEIIIIYLFQTVYGVLHLHIGLILAVFMAGLALGAGLSGRLKIRSLILPIMLAIVAAPLAGLVILSDSGLKVAYFIFYMGAVCAGFSTGGGFGYVAERADQAPKSGATLYAADLCGALLAALLAPGILMSQGTFALSGSLAVLSAIIVATLVHK
jgi:hypothetical protein